MDTPKTRAQLAEEAKRLVVDALNIAESTMPPFKGATPGQQAICKALDAIDALATAGDAQEAAWISVEDRLPDVSGIDDGEAVLVANRGGSFCAEWHGTGITGFSSHGYDDQFAQVTHWQPLPAAPAIAAPAQGGGVGEAL